MKTKVISIMNSKGGVGKTITAANMAQIIASEYGHRVLAIDLDPQADLTALLGLPIPMGDHLELEDIAGAFDLLTGAWGPGTVWQHPADIVHHTRYTGLDLVPSCSQMLVLGLTSADDCTKRLSDFIAAISEMDNPYHFVVIDCPPAFSGPSAAAIYCRQMLFEYAPAIKVIVNDENGNLIKVAAEDLLPFAWKPVICE